MNGTDLSPPPSDSPADASHARDEAAVLLLVEDSPEDAEAMRRAFGRCGIPPARMVHCSNVEEVMDYLHRRGPHADRDEVQLPRLMVLDLNMPGLDGKAMLGTLKAREEWRAMPVVVFTSSTREEDVEACYRLGANSYVTKPQGWEELLALAEKTKQYWFDTVITPVLRR